MAQFRPQLGKTVTLAINDRASLVEMNELKGLKTVFVRPVPNWPDSLGNYPIVPMDIEIFIRNKVGAAWVEDTVALPACGMAMQVNGDGLEVNAYYSPKQGLGTPYVSYFLEAGIAVGPDPQTPSRVFWTNTYANCFGASYPTAVTALPIPSYSRQFRVESTGQGYVLINDPSPLATFQLYDFQLANQWIAIPPEMYQWRRVFIAPGQIPLISPPNESFMIEFM